MADPELEAMSAVAAAFADLDQPTRTRVVRWAADRFDVALPSAGRAGVAVDSQSGGDVASGAVKPPEQGFDEFVDLFDAVNPDSAMERALTGAYWIQVVRGGQTWASQAVNELLKDTGHGITNVTDALSRAQNHKPALVRQVSKSGRAAQARKTYKLTTSGIAMIRAAMGAAALAVDEDE